MTSKLEQIALAINNCGAYSPDWQGADEDLVVMARAAVEAIREPSADMVVAGELAGPMGEYEALPIGKIYRAMIDKVLSEKPE